MTIEASQYISQLNSSFPRSTDLLKEGDDHIRMIKANLKSTFPNFTGSIAISSDELNNFINATSVGPSGIQFVKSVSLSSGAGIFNVNNNKISNVGNPTADRDAVNRKWLIDTIYPIGAVYLSFSDLSPNTFLPGTTWEQVAQGRMLIGAGGNGSTQWNVPQNTNAGSLGFNLVEENMPAHSHSMFHGHSAAANPDGAHSHGLLVGTGGETGNVWALNQRPHNSQRADDRIFSTPAHTHAVTVSNFSGQTGSVGVGRLVNYLPNCYGVKVWARTA